MGEREHPSGERGTGRARRAAGTTATSTARRADVGPRVASSLQAPADEPQAPADRLAAFAAATGQLTWTASPDGGFQDVGSWSAFTGERDTQVCGAGWLAAVHPDDRPRAEAAWRTAVASRGGFECELRIRRFDGVYRTFLARAAALADAAGSVREWVGFGTDISERVGREHHTLAALEALARIAEVVVLPLQPAPDFSVSGAHLVAGRLAELARRALACKEVTIAAFAPQTQHLLPLAAAGFAAESGESWSMETLLRVVEDQLDASALAHLRDGLDLLPGAMSKPPGCPTLDRTLLFAPLAASEELQGVLAVTYPSGYECTTSQRMLAVTVGKLIALVIERERLLRDRAEARARVLAMRQAKSEMDEFLSIASHELKTPLTSIRGFIQLAEQRLRALAAEERTTGLGAGMPRDAAHPERVDRVRIALERAEFQTGQMSRLINELLDASRVHASRLELHLARSDLAAMVREIVEEQRLTWPGRVIHLEVPGAGHATQPEAAPTPVLVLMDGARMGQVLTNFLTNALKYSPAAQPVLVRLTVAAGQACVSVCDRGPGIPLEEQARVWERFYRSKQVSTQHGPEGLGLGLYISHAIVERHGGQVGLQSQLGAGATFSFTLALAPVD